MKIFPAVDIKDGKAVRLKRGDFNQAKVYFDNPVEAAQKWIADGTKVLHVVDLDGARDGILTNTDSIKAIAALDVKVQLGGGMRTLESLQQAFNLGVWRIVIGTALIKDRSLAKQACDKFGVERIVAGVDLKDGMVAIQGWQEGAQVSYETLLEQLQNLGIKNLIVTDVNRDGMQEGPNLKLMKEIINLRLVGSRKSGVSRAGSPNTPKNRSTKFNVIASGGVSSLADVRKLTEIGLSGAIVGTALYEGSFRLSQALEAANVS